VEKVRRRREQAVAERVAQDTGCYLVGMRESPDAELRAPGGKTVGLEVVSVADEEYLGSRRRLLETTEAIEQTLIDTGLQIHVTIGFDLQSFGVAVDNGSHKTWLRNLDVLSLLGVQPSGELNQDALREKGIERIAWLSWHPSQTPGAGWGYSKRTERGRTLVDLCLAKKHQKLVKYKEANSFESFWLAIDSLGPGTLEDGGFSMLLERNFGTAFDRVFLMIRGADQELSEARDVTPVRGLL
jgi:hypothetical protein